MADWIFFDLGWTLVDEAPAHRYRWEAVSRILSGWHIAISADDLERMAQREATAFAQSPFRAVLDGLDLTEQRRTALIEAAPYPKDRERLYPATRPVLEKLRSLHRLAIVANQSKGTESRLRAWGIMEYLSLVVASAEVGLSKPDPGIFLHAMESAECTPKQATFVGDRLDNDISPAKRLGCRTIRVLQGIHRLQIPRTDDENADLTLSNLDELPFALPRPESAL